MNSIEQFFLNSGLSWTMSKFLPYLLFPLLGLLIWYVLRKKIRQRVKNKWIKGGIVFLFFAIPFGIYFYAEPIYEGDFSNNSVQIVAKGELKNVQKAKLFVITIPNCPFCQESILRMKAFKKRNPKVAIEYLVCSSEPMSAKHYQQIAGNSFSVHLAKNPQQMGDVANGNFPAFVLSNGKTMSKWSNDSFGVVALDEVEEQFEK